MDKLPVEILNKILDCKSRRGAQILFPAPTPNQQSQIKDDR